MAKKARPKEQKSQRERFIEFAKEHGADDPRALDKAMGDIVKATPKPKEPKT